MERPEAGPLPPDPAITRVPHVLIVDDHAQVADRLVARLGQLGEPLRVFVASSMPEAFARLRSDGDINLVLLDIRMPGRDRLARLRQLRELRAALPVVILSAATGPGVVAAVRQAGARGVIPTTMNAAAILHVLRLILTGETYFPADARTDARTDGGADGAPTEMLSPREREVLAELVAGKPNKEIARALGIGQVTVSMHLTHIYRKLKVSSRTQAVRDAVALKLVPPGR